jgi:hypothetical protein
MTFPLGVAGRAALAPIGKAPAAEASANLRRLKELLEAGKVINTDHAVEFPDARPWRPVQVSPPLAAGIVGTTIPSAAAP